MKKPQTLILKLVVSLLLVTLVSEFTLPTAYAIDYGLLDSYTVSMTSYTIYLPSFPALGQSWHMPNERGYNLSTCKFRVARVGTVTDRTVVARLYGMSGVYGTTSIPNATLYATSAARNVSDFGITFSLQTFTFDATYVLVKDVPYVIVIACLAGTWNSTQAVKVSDNGITPGHPGNTAVQALATWSPAVSSDLVFYVYGVADHVYSTFAYSDEGTLVVNGTAYGNETVAFINGDSMYLVMAVEANFTFFNWTYDASSSTDNPFILEITSNLTVTAYIGELAGGTVTITVPGETVIVTERYIHPLTYVAIGLAIVCATGIAVEEKKKRS